MHKITHKEETSLKIPGRDNSGTLTWYGDNNQFRLWLYHWNGLGSSSVGLYLTPQQARQFANNIIEAVELAESRRKSYLELGYNPKSSWWSRIVAWLPFH